MRVGIIFPVFNEEKRLERGITETIKFLRSHISFNYNIYIIDNASWDSTGEIAHELESKYDNVSYHRIEAKGVGVAFRKGVEVAGKDDIVGYMDVDLSTDVAHLREVEALFASGEFDIVNGSRFNRNSKISGRKWYRNITSHGLVFLLKLFLKMEASDAICGFKFFRRDVVLELMSESSSENGWFYIIELLLRAEKEGKRICELPVRWRDDVDNSTVDIPKVIISYLKGIRNLRKNFRNTFSKNGEYFYGEN